MNAMVYFKVSEEIDRLMDIHRATNRAQLRLKLGLSKNTIRNWEIAGKVPEKYLRPSRKPVQLLAAVAVLRDERLTDFDARRAALSFLQQLEAAHG